MSKPKVRVKVRQGKGKRSPARIKVKIVGQPYIGEDAVRLQRELDAQKAKADSLQKEIDSLKCQIKIIIKEQQ